ncbi:MAG: Rid family detoxifying hydrolase [Planctomycetota bacterium]|nr:Rid family detoxifying hydrolase [Planctomycetota bacterium]
MSELWEVNASGAPAAVGAYSQAIKTGGLVFTSGCLPINPADKTMPEDVKEQAKTSLTNLKAILEAAGSGLDRVAKTTVFLSDIKDFQAVNEVYAAFFGKPYPARSCFAVAALPLGAKLEIEAVAALK